MKTEFRRFTLTFIIFSFQNILSQLVWVDGNNDTNLYNKNINYNCYDILKTLRNGEKYNSLYIQFG